MKRKVLLLIAIGYATISLAQSHEIVPIILDGKPAFLNVTTGKVVTKRAANAKKYKKIKLNGFSNSFKNTSKTAIFSAEGTHTVSSGETLYAISQMYGLSVSTLKKINGLASNNLQIGQVLQVQNNIEETSADISTLHNTHTVVSGETLYAISKKYGLSVSKLKALNNLTNNTISIGEELVVE